MSEEILFEVANGWGEITLNRPQQLNALTLGMVQAMGRQLSAWRSDDSVKAVLIKAVPGRAFCAGGDIRYLYEKRKAGDIDACMQFFGTEYLNNWRVAEFPKPFVALMDGAVMGGGVGISMHGDFRVATENALFSMPECGIGLYPDVGATYMLPHLEGAIGMWLALTGTRLAAADMVRLGLATHTVKAAGVAELVAELENIEWGEDNHALVKRALDMWHVTPPGETPALDHLTNINEAFALDSSDEVLKALDTMRDDSWAAGQRAAIERACPLSIRVTHRAMKLGEKMDMTEALQMEYALTRKFVEDSIFIEGVRAQIIDKDRNPVWPHSSIKDVSRSDVDAMFRPAPDPINLTWDDPAEDA